MSKSRQYSEKELLDALRERADELGRAPKSREMGGPHPSAGTYQTHFGSWSAAVKAADLNPVRERNISDSDLLAEISRLASHENPPKRKEMAERGVYSTTTYENRFGSWNKAVIQAGFEPANYRTVPRDKLIDDLRSLADDSPSGQDIQNEATFSVSAYLHEFGSLPCAREAAGLKRKAEYPSGHEHHNWSGGYSWYLSIRNACLNESWDNLRDIHLKDECKMCEQSESLILHHIVPVLSGGPNEGWNFMTLCQGCHPTIESATREFTAKHLVLDEWQ